MYQANTHYKDGTEVAVGLETREEKGGIALRLSEALDYSKVEYIEILFEDMSCMAGEDGYILISAHEHVGKAMEDYGLCYYNERENMQYVSGILRCPVFGIKKRNKGILGIATGMPMHARQVIEVEDNIYRMSIRFQVNGETPYEQISVLVYELEGTDAEYSGMARTYRNYQLEYGGFHKISDRITPQLDYAKKSVYVRVRQGWKPVPTQIEDQTPENEPPMYVACTFKQVEKLVEEYYKAGIRDAEFCLVGWNIKGHDGRWPQIFPVEESLGGEEDLRELICKAKELGFEISCHTNFTESFTIAENFDIDNMVVNRQGERPSVAVWAGGRSYTACPEKALENAKQQLPEVAELGFGGLNYIDVMTCVAPPACYHPNHPLTRREGQYYWKEIFKLSKELFGGLSSEGAVDYCLSECDYCLYTSFSREPEKAWELFDKEVPFWQIVYHGICLYNSYSRTVNSAMSQNPANLLKSLECGDRPTVYYYSKFKSDGKNWMGDKDFRCGTEEEIQEGIVALKKQYDIFKKMEYLQTVFIESHTETSPNVFEVRYEDGSVVTADYNEMTLSLKNNKGTFSVIL